MIAFRSLSVALLTFVLAPQFTACVAADSQRGSNMTTIEFRVSKSVSPYKVKREVDMGGGITETTWDVGSLLVIELLRGREQIPQREGFITGLVLRDEQTAPSLEIGSVYKASIPRELLSQLSVPADPERGARWFVPPDALQNLQKFAGE